MVVNNCIGLTEYGKTILSLLQSNEKLQELEFVEYRPELRHRYWDCYECAYKTWDCFKVVSNFGEQILAYNDSDHFRYTSVKKIDEKKLDFVGIKGYY